MSIREDFEAWAEPKGYPLRTIETGERISYSYGPTLSAFAGYQAATSRQEARIKALVEALEEMVKVEHQGNKADHYSRRAAHEDAQIAIAAAKETP